MCEKPCSIGSIFTGLILPHKTAKSALKCEAPECCTGSVLTLLILPRTILKLGAIVFDKPCNTNIMLILPQRETAKLL